VFAHIHGKSASEQAAALLLLTSWTDAGPGGYYDDLGELDAMHYVHNVSTETGDQALHPTALLTTTGVSDQYYQVPPDSDKSAAAPHFTSPPKMRSQMTFVSTTGCIAEHPITMKYPGLPANTGYYVYITYDSFDEGATCTANGLPCPKPTDEPNGKKKFVIPPQATEHGGDLVIEFFKPDADGAFYWSPATTPTVVTPSTNSSSKEAAHVAEKEKKFGGIVLSEVWLVVVAEVVA
jgi:hypothetical protein